MKIKSLNYDWDYGTVGEIVKLYKADGSTIDGDFIVGDIYKVIYNDEKICESMVVSILSYNERIPCLMGFGDFLTDNEKIENLILSHKDLEVGYIYDNSLIITES